MEKVKLADSSCTLKFGRYYNNTIAIEAFHGNGELCIVPTINWERYFEGQNYKAEFIFPRIVIEKRKYKAQERTYDELLKAGVIRMDMYLSGTGGEIQAAMLTEKWQAIARQQLKLKVTEAAQSAKMSIFWNYETLLTPEVLHQYATLVLQLSDVAAKEFAVGAKDLIGSGHYDAMEEFCTWYYINYIGANGNGTLSITQAREIGSTHFNLLQAEPEKQKAIISCYGLLELDFTESKRDRFAKRALKRLNDQSKFKGFNLEQFFLWYYINYVLPLKDYTGEAIETNPICC